MAALPPFATEGKNLVRRAKVLARPTASVVRVGLCRRGVGPRRSPR